MLLFKKRFVRAGLIIVLSGFLLACQSAPAPATQSEAGISVSIRGDTCPNVIVQAGQQVTWTNQDTGEHIVRDNSTKEGSLFDSGILQPGDSFTFIFVDPGSYPYECSEDGTMRGIVTVQA